LVAGEALVAGAEDGVDEAGGANRLVELGG
jgi:hypothetical protein